jgi:hypothetical protein
LSYFIAKVVLFFVIFGGFAPDFALLVGLIGFNISLNGGVAKKTAPVVATSPHPALNRFRSPLRVRPVISS